MSHLLDIPWTPASELDFGDRAAYRTPFYSDPEVRRLRVLNRMQRRLRTVGKDLPAHPAMKQQRYAMDTPAVKSRQCVGVGKINLERCQRSALRGQIVCAFHGGNKPLAKIAAKQRLLAMCEPAFGVLEELLREPGVEDEVKLKAAIAVLDRAGFGPKATLTVKDKRGSLDAMNEEQMVQRGKRILQILEERREQVVADAIEGELVEETR